MIKISHIDHLVLTVKDIEATVKFYESVMGMTKQAFGEGGIALLFGNQKIHHHEFAKKLEPKAKRPIPGSTDLCSITATSLQEAIPYVKSKDVEVIAGPVIHTGAIGAIKSFYFTVPDGNLIEVARPS